MGPNTQTCGRAAWSAWLQHTRALLSGLTGCHAWQVRKNGTCPWLRPDGKTQVTVEYYNDAGAMVPQRVHTVLISTQHSPDVSNEYIHKELMEHVIKPVVPAKYLDDKTIFHLNPSGVPALCDLEPATQGADAWESKQQLNTCLAPSPAAAGSQPSRRPLSVQGAS